MVRDITVLFRVASVGIVALGLSGQDVCLPGVATAGCSQLQMSAKVPGFQLTRDAASFLSEAERASMPNASFVEIEGGLAMQSGAQLAESFLRSAGRAELALATLQERMSPATEELSNAVAKLVEDQGASPVGCKARLKQAQLKLKEIVATIMSTFNILSTTKKEVQVVDTQLKQTLLSIKDANTEKTKGFTTCAEKKATDKTMLEKLMDDMKTMRKMRKVTLDGKLKFKRIEERSQGLQSLLETGDRLPATSGNATSSVSSDHADVQNMIGHAKVASLEMHNCMKQHASASLLESGSTAVVDNFDLISDDLVSDALQDDEDEDDAGDEDGETQETPVASDQTVVALPAVQATNSRGRPRNAQVRPQVSIDPRQPQPLVTTRPGKPMIEEQAQPQPWVTTRPGPPEVQVQPQPLVTTRPGPPSTVDPTAPTLATEPEHCKAERETLKETWVVAYEELTREVESYEILVDDTSCVDAEEAEYEETFQPLQQQEQELSHKVYVAISKVQTLRPQLKGLRSARKELQKRLEIIAAECEALVKTKETLEVTKEVIVEMDDCAGLDASAFALPVWVGQWITVDLSEDLSIKDADDKMSSACAESFGEAARAAEVSEIDTGSVRRMPKKNDANLPMMPACPMCGTQGSRVCWDSGAKLNHQKRRTDCTPGNRAVLCVSPDDAQQMQPRSVRMQ